MYFYPSGDCFTKSQCCILSIFLQGEVAFVAQQAWIQNATVRENILFGHPYEEEKYEKIVEAVALRPDFDILDNGDLTLIGEKVNNVMC